MSSELPKSRVDLKLFLIALALVGIVALAIALAIQWAQPPCSTCHIERTTPASGEDSAVCLINGRIDGGWFLPGAMSAMVNGAAASDLNDADGYKAGECVNIPLESCEEPKLSFSHLAVDFSWDNPLCKTGDPQCTPCK